MAGKARRGALGQGVVSQGRRGVVVEAGQGKTGWGKMRLV